MIRPRSSTAFRFAAFYSLAFTVLILALGAVMYWAVRSELRYDLDQRVIIERNAVVRDAAVQGLARVVAERSGDDRGDMQYALIDASGRLVAGRKMVAPPKRLGWSEIDFVKDNGDPDYTRLIVGADPEAIESLDDRMLPLFAIAFGLIVAIGIAGAFWLGGAITRRLASINRTADAIIGGDLSQRMPLTGSDDEFDRLSATLNLMLDRIAGLLDNLHQVSSDIAHDLRTPLTRLRQKLELGSGDAGDVEALRRAIEEASVQTDEILSLFTAILSISEIEGSALRFKQFDLSGLIADVADSYVLAAEDTGRKLTRTVAPGIVINGQRELVAQLFVNLLDNALRHTPDRAEIAVTLQSAGDRAVLIVSDNGPGIAEEDRGRVFERFVRLDRSRTTPGHGLGLRLVAAIAAAHGATTALEDNHPGVKMMIGFERGAA
jgi:signal transduction histidine kinase